MLIVCNGALKSGSTWLLNILTSLVKVKHPPAKYLTERSPLNPCIREDKLEDFLREINIRTTNYISKNHYNKSHIKEILLANPDVYVFDIERDIRDVIVSAYYHDCRVVGYAGSFNFYYWKEGRRLADFILSYHRLWNDGHPHVYVASYERLKNDFDGEVARIASVLGVETTAAQRQAIRESTTLSRLRDRYKQSPGHASKENPFFRKGEVGDWRNHFSQRALEDLKRIEERGLSRFDALELAKTAISRLGRLARA